MDNKENIVQKLSHNKKLIVVTIVSLLFIVIGVSYAFFSDKLFGTNEALNFGNGLNVEFVLDGESNLSFSFDPLKMTNMAEEEYIDSDTRSNGTVTLTNHSEYENVTCEYEVWYKADITFDNDYDAKDMAVVANRTTKEPEGSQFDETTRTYINEVEKGKDKKVADGYIIVGPNGETSVQEWDF